MGWAFTASRRETCSYQPWRFHTAACTGHSISGPRDVVEAALGIAGTESALKLLDHRRARGSRELGSRRRTIGERDVGRTSSSRGWLSGFSSLSLIWTANGPRRGTITDHARVRPPDPVRRGLDPDGARGPLPPRAYGDEFPSISITEGSWMRVSPVI
jgi:hypothetical protein